MQVARFGIGIILLTVIGTSIASLVFDRWMIASVDNTLVVAGLRQACSNLGCDSIDYGKYNNALCPGEVTGTSYERIATGAWALIIIGVILFGVASLIVLASAFLTQLYVLLMVASAILTVAILTFGIGGALAYYINNQYLNCGFDYCTFMWTSVSTITYCLHEAGPSFTLWCVTLAMSVPATVSCGFLHYHDKSKQEMLQKSDFKKTETKPSMKLGAATGNSSAGFISPIGYVARQGFNMLYSVADDMFFDSQKGHYFSLKSNLFYDPIKEIWYSSNV